MLSYAPSDHWNAYFQRHADSGRDLDWGDQWTGAFIDVLRAAEVRTVLDLGCGTGNDVLRLKRAGFQAVGMDYSSAALQQAVKKSRDDVLFVQADMAQPLPFPTSTFDALMSNVALHMFSDAVTRALFKEIARLVRPGGLFVFHVNALEDRALREAFGPGMREIEPNYVLEAHGQTMHFFSDDYLHDLLEGWSEINLAFISIMHPETGQPYKYAWRGIVRK